MQMPQNQMQVDHSGHQQEDEEGDEYYDEEEDDEVPEIVNS